MTAISETEDGQEGGDPAPAAGPTDEGAGKVSLDELDHRVRGIIGEPSASDLRRWRTAGGILGLRQFDDAKSATAGAHTTPAPAIPVPEAAYDQHQDQDRQHNGTHHA
ncbi:MAG: hypothetical protein V3R66_01915 [Rhodospirillales bacterium]